MVGKLEDTKLPHVLHDVWMRHCIGNGATDEHDQAVKTGMELCWALCWQALLSSGNTLANIAPQPPEGWNCQRIARMGYRLQWQGDNVDQMHVFFAANGCICESMCGGRHLLLKIDGATTGMAIGSWVVKGEDGKLRIYTDKEMRPKYVSIAPRANQDGSTYPEMMG